MIYSIFKQLARALRIDALRLTPTQVTAGPDGVQLHEQLELQSPALQEQLHDLDSVFEQELSSPVTLPPTPEHELPEA